MKYRSRIYYNAEQKNLMWDRWPGCEARNMEELLRASAPPDEDMVDLIASPRFLEGTTHLFGDRAL